MREPAPGEPWTRAEIDAVVVAYMNMLREELAGRRPNKAAVVRMLREQLTARSSRSIEFKLQNISAVLDENQLAWINGYKPASHYQGDLVYPTLEAFRADRGLAESVENYSAAALVAPSRRSLATDDVRADPPGSSGSGHRRSSVGLTVGPTGAVRDFQNRRLGAAGEQWVIDLEREQLRRAGRRDLADRVKWVSRDEGDGAGYDVRSYRLDGSELKVEVKTTNWSARTPFYITRWEVDVSRVSADSYALYRVYGFARDPLLYVLEGSIEEVARLEPKVYLGLPI